MTRASSAIVDLESVQVERVTDKVYTVIRQRILDGTYRPGARLPVDQMAQQLGVSQTPVKGAIARLVTEGLVTSQPRRGTFVAEITGRGISESFSIRVALEELAAETLLDHLTDQDLASFSALVTRIEHASEVDEHFLRNMEFHERLVGLSHNQRLAEIYRQLNAHVQMALIHSRSESWQRRVPDETAEHLAILEAMTRQDVVALKSAIHAHLGRARISLLGQLQPHGNEPV